MAIFPLETSYSIFIHLKGGRGMREEGDKKNKIRKNGKGNEKEVEKLRRQGNARMI